MWRLGFVGYINHYLDVSLSFGDFMNKTGFFFHEECLWHSGGNYAFTVPVGGFVQPLAAGGLPENPETKRRFKNLIEVSGLAKDIDILSSRRATVEELMLVHTKKYIKEFMSLSEEGGGELGRQVPFGPGGFEIASRSAGLVVSAVSSVMSGDFNNAYALSRPPGHHCLPDVPNGFCLLNNIGVAVRAAQANKEVERVAIVDWDVHHGNGTENIFYTDPNVLTISVHQERNYPLNTGDISQRGEAGGLGFNLNIPLPPGSGHEVYVQTMKRLVEPSINLHKPDLIIVACGFDASGVDPLSRMLCGANTFREMTRSIIHLAENHCDGKFVMAHEGGYSELHVPFCGHAVLQEMSGSVIEVFDPLKSRIDGQQPSKEFNDFVSGKINNIEKRIFG